MGDSIIGLMGAMDSEIQYFLDRMENRKTTEDNGIEFHEGKLHGKGVVLVKSGTGKQYTTWTITKLIKNYNLACLLFAGVAGALDPTLKIGDVVVATKSVQHDFDLRGYNPKLKVGQLSAYTDEWYFETDKKLVELALSAKLGGFKIVKGIVLTGDRFVDVDEKMNNLVFRELGGTCIDMEGSAVGFVCNKEKIPHLLVRGISDELGHEGSSFKNHLKLSALNACKVIDQMVPKLD